jgi:uncharacterized protein (TIGR03083 family)
VEVADHIDALRRQGDLLAAAAARAGLDAPVPTCPSWQIKDLLRHTGYVHRWATRHIVERPDKVLDGPAEEEILRGGAPDADLLAWFRDGYGALADTLAAADPALVCAVFMDAPSPLAFWARRQAHETAMHRADAELALGAWPDYAPDFAADGVDELIIGFGQRRRYRPPADTKGSLQVHATDTGHTWHAAAQDGRIRARRQISPAAGPTAPVAETNRSPASEPVSLVSGPAVGLYLFLWNRSDAARANVTISGDPAFFNAWRSAVRVSWD